jgi:hypothetical protein
MKKNFVAVLTIIILSGCATRPGKISAERVPMSAYAGATCEQLEREMYLAEKDAEKYKKKQGTMHQTDLATFWTGMILLWPAVFVPIFTPEYDDELAEAKGHVVTIDDTMHKEGCNNQFTSRYNDRRW